MLNYNSIESNEFSSCGVFPIGSTDISATNSFSNFGGSGKMVQSGANSLFFKNDGNSVGLNNNNNVSAEGTGGNYLVQKGSENVKRFSVNNLLQLASCNGGGNSRGQGKFFFFNILSLAVFYSI